MVGDSERLRDTLEELATESVGAVISEVARELVDVVGTSVGAETISKDELSTSVADALALVANVLGYGLATDATADEDGTRSASDALVAWDEVVEDDAVIDNETDDEAADVLVVDSALDDAIGAFAGVDDGDEYAGLQLPKPGWQPLPQYASVLPLYCVSMQKHATTHSRAERTSRSIYCSNYPTWIQHKSSRWVTLRRHCRIAHWSRSYE
jgi:hypothetical protein